MVAIVAGNGLGLFNASSNILGSIGVLGQGVLGQAGGRSFVNAATGNLILQGLDEHLSGRGADLNLLRTYNSRGTLITNPNDPQFDQDEDGNRWRWNDERTVKFNGGGAAGSGGSVTRTSGDGHATTYTWDATTQSYLSTEGGDAHDFLKYEAATATKPAQWVWTDGTTRQQDRYGDSTGPTMTGRLQSQTDVSGNKITFGYDASNRLTSVIDFGSGQKISLVYAGTQLNRVETYELNVDPNTGKITEPPTVGTSPIKQVEYLYDNGRIGTVKTILNPGGGTPTYYSTTYTYQSASSSLITNVAQSDGTSVAFTYYPTTDANAGKLWTVTDANGKQTFKYTSATQTDIEITDSAGNNKQTWTYTYDATTKQLKKIESPAVGGTRLTTTITYDDPTVLGASHLGNVQSITQAIGGGKPDRTVSYKYDDRGNRIREYDSLANTISRTFDSLTNQLLTETHYKSPDTNVTDNTLPSDAMTTHFVYDEQSRLRFVVSAEGRVSESRYNSNGLLERTVQYAADRYSDTKFAESDLAGWVANIVTNKSNIQLCLYAYDFRGNLSKRTDFSKTNATTGEGSLDTDAAATVTEYTYDSHSQLLHTIAVRGTARDQRSDLTSIAYDGLGRETQRINSSGTRTTHYNGVGYTGGVTGGPNTIQVTTTAGLTELSTFDSAGRLTSLNRSGSGSTRATRYFYDPQGRLAMMLDPQGGRHFYFYDPAGRIAYQVDSAGEVTGYTYNDAGQTLSETHYKNTIGSTDTWLDDKDNPTKVNKTALVVAAAAGDNVNLVTDAKDRMTTFGYDDAARLTTRTDAANTVTTTHYDGASRITDQQTGSRTTRYFYDRDNNQVGVVDPLGFLTEYEFDSAGNPVETVRYATRSPNATNVSAPVWIGVSNQTAVGGQLFSYRLPAVDADGDKLDGSAYSIVSTDAGGWLTLDTSNSTGAAFLTGTPPKTLRNYTVTLHVTDGRGGSATDVTLQITVANTAPRWSDLRDTSVRINNGGAGSYSYVLPEASDNESAVAQLTYSLVSAPVPGLTLTGRTLSGVPTQAGIYMITVRVADSQGLPTEKSFWLTVTNDGPTWDRVRNLPAVFVNSPFDVTPPPAVDPEKQTLTYSVVSLPAGLSFDPTTRRISGTVQGLGIQNIVLRAEDPTHESVVLSFSYSANNRPPSWPGLSDTVATRINEQNSAFAYSYHPPLAVEPDGETLIYSALGLPSGLTVNSADGSISGTSYEAGEFAVTLRATDPHGAFVERSVVVRLFDWNPSTTTNQVFAQIDSPPDGISESFVFDGYFQDLNDKNGVVGDRLRYTIRGDSTPWASLDAANRFKVTVPSSAPVGTTTKHVFVVATDPWGKSITLDFKIVVIKSRTVNGNFVTTGIENASAAAAEPLLAQPPLDDVLSGWRPATNAKDLHRFRYYDGKGRLVGSVDERGFLSETIYNEQDNKQTNLQYADALTVSGSDTLDALKGRAGSSKATTIDFDAFGRVQQSTDVYGTVTRNEYDANSGLLVRQISGYNQVDAANHSEARATRTQFNAFGEVIGTLGGEGDAWLTADNTRTLQNAINTRGMRYEYDSLGRRTKAIDANNNATLFFYDRESCLTHTVNAKGEVSETLYNPFGQASSVRRYATRLTPGQVSALTGGSNAALVSVLTADDSHDQYTSYEYENRGLLTTTTPSADVAGFVSTTTNNFNAYGDLETQIRAIAAGKSVTTRFDYDLAGQLLSTTADVGGINFNTQRAYDAYGRVIKSIDAAGKVTATEYLDAGRRIVVTDPLGHAVRTEYDAFSRVTTVVDAREQTTSYTYNETDRSVTVTTPEGVHVTTKKTRQGETLSVTDGRGNTTKYEYNKDGQLTKLTDALNNAVAQNTYDNAGRLSQTTDARGVVTTLSYDALNRVLQRRVDPKDTTANPNGLDLVTAYEFDAFGQQITVTEGVGDNAGSNIARVTKYIYDRKGQLDQVIVDPDGLKLATTYRYNGLGNTIQVARGTVTSPNQQVTQYVFDPLGRRVEEIEAPSAIFGADTARTRDISTKYRYDLSGRVSRKIDANGNSTWYAYTAAGQIKQTINALGEVSENSYDLDDRLVFTRQYAKRLSATVLASLGDSPGTVTPATDTNDRRAYFSYNNDGQQRFTLQTSGAADWAISENRYDENRNLIETRRYDKALSDTRINALATSEGISTAQVATELATLGFNDSTPSTLAAVQRTRFAYDKKNQLRFTVDALGDVSERVYDNAGNVLTTVRYAVRPTLSAAPDETEINNAVVLANAGNQVSQFSYDKVGRLRHTVRLLAAATSATPPRQLVTRQTYDALGRVVQSTSYAKELGSVSNYDAATLDTALADSSFASDVANRTTAFAYNAAGQQVYSVQVLFDAQGNVKNVLREQTVDALGHVLKTTAYATALGALSDYKMATLQGAIVGSAQDRTIERVFDFGGHERFTIAADGSLSEMAYNALGQMTEQRQYATRISPSTATTELHTEADLIAARGDRHALGDEFTRGARYSYDAAGRALTTTDALGFVETNAYNALGDRISYTDKNNNTWNYVYDRLGRLTSKTAPAVMVQLSDQAAPTSRRPATTYEYNAAGNMFRQIEAAGTVDARETVHSYDTLGREILVTRPGYFDPVTGRVEKTNDTGRFQRTVATIYDALGNVVRTAVKAGPSTFLFTYQTYDALGRQTYAVDALNNATAFGYNSFGEQTTLTRFSLNIGAVAGGGNAVWKASDIATKVSGDTKSRTMTTVYDNLGRQTDVTQPVSTFFNTATGATYSSAARTHLDYNSFGEVYHQAVKLDGINDDTHPDGHWRDTWHYFDTRGREVRTVDTLGYHTARSFDALGNLTQTVEYATLWTKGSLGNFTPPTAPDTSDNDRVTNFLYNTLNQQTSVQRLGMHYSLWNATTGTYEQVDETRDWATTISVTTYDHMGRVSTQKDALGNLTTTQYDALGQVTQVTAPAQMFGSTAGVDPFVAQGKASALTSFTYNSFGQVVKQERGYVADTSNPGFVPAGARLTTLQTYDFDGNLIASSDLNKNRNPDTYVVRAGDTLESIAQTLYGSASLWNQVLIENHLNFGPNFKSTDTLPAGEVGKIYNVPGYKVRSGDTLASIAQTIYGDKSLWYLIAVANNELSFKPTDVLPSGEPVKVYRLPSVKLRQVNYAGQVTKETQATNATLGNWQTVSHTLERRYTYDASGRQTDTLDVYKDGTVVSLTGQRNKYNAFGEVTETRKVWGADGAALTSALVATYTYDDAGHVSSQQAVDGLTKFFYNVAGQVVRQEKRGNDSTADGTATRVAETEYDELGRATLQRLPSFQARLAGATTTTAITPVTEQAYDRWGNVTQRNQGGYMLGGSKLTTEQVITRYDYNADNQMTAEHLPTATAYKVDGGSYSANVTHVLRYDLLGRVVQEVDTVADDTGTAANEARTLRLRSRQYDATGNVVAEVDGTGVTTRYTYDINGNRIGTLLGAGTALAIVYVDQFDNGGNVVSHSVLRQANGSRYTGGAGQTAALYTVRTYAYDQAHRRVVSGDVMHDAQGTLYTYTLYDERNQVRAQRTPNIIVVAGTGGGPRDVGIVKTFGYDQFGNKASEQVGSTTQSWDYSKNLTDFSVGRLISNTVGNHRTDYSYNDFGQVLQQSYTDINNGHTAGSLAYAYHDNGLLKDQTDTIFLGARGSGTREGVDFRQWINQDHHDYTVLGQESVETYTSAQSGETRNSSGGFVDFTGPTSSRTTLTSYDAQGRVATVRAPASLNAGRAVLDPLTYHYDELGNRREIIAAGTAASDKWYDYDAEGRVTVVEGVVDTSNNRIDAGATGTAITYDALGRRSTAEVFVQRNRWTGDIIHNNERPGWVHTNELLAGVDLQQEEYREEKYEYDDLGHLQAIKQQLHWRDQKLVTGTHAANPTTTNPANQSSDYFNSQTLVNDVRGGVITRSIYRPLDRTGPTDAVSPALAQIVNTGFLADGRVDFVDVLNQIAPERSSRTRNFYDGNTGLLSSYTYAQGANLSAPTLANTYTYTYTLEFGGLRESNIAVTTSASDAVPGSTLSQYDRRGNLVQQTVVDTAVATSQKTHYRYFTYDSAGRITTKIEGGSDTGNVDYFFAGDRQVAAIGTGSLATTQFSNDFTPVSAAYPGDSPGTYVVTTGDTLAGIARAVFGDGSLWYLIADENSVSAGPNDTLSSVEVGRSYRIPNVVGNVHNNADTFTPYSASRIIGSGAPSMNFPAAPSDCGRIYQVIATAVTMATEIIVAKVGGSLLGAFLGPQLGNGIAGAVGNATGQGMGNLLGIRHGFSFEQVGRAGANAFVSAGFNEAIGKATGTASDFLGIAMRGFTGFVMSGLSGRGGDPANTFVNVAMQFSGVASPAVEGIMQLGVGIASQPGGFSWARLAEDAFYSVVSTAAGRAGDTLGKAALNWLRPPTTSPLAQEYARNRGSWNRYLSTSGATRPVLSGESDIRGEGAPVNAEGSSGYAFSQFGGTGVSGANWASMPWARYIDGDGEPGVYASVPPDPETLPNATVALDPETLANATVADPATLARRGDITSASEPILLDTPKTVPVNPQNEPKAAPRTSNAMYDHDLIDAEYRGDSVCEPYSDGTCTLDVQPQETDDVNQLRNSMTQSPVVQRPIAPNPWDENVLDRDAVDALRLGDINDASDIGGGVVALAGHWGDAIVKISKDTHDVQDFINWAEELGLQGLADNQRLRLATSGMGEVGLLSKFAKTLGVLGKAADALGIATDFGERAFGNASPAQTAPFKVLDGTLTALSNYAFGAKTPIGAMADTLQDKVFGWQPVPVQSTVKGSSSAISVLLEAYATGNTAGGDELSKRALGDPSKDKGEYGWIHQGVQLEGVDYRDHGGREIVWRTGQFYAHSWGPVQYLERPAALGASVPELGLAGDAIGRGAGWAAVNTRDAFVYAWDALGLNGGGPSLTPPSLDRFRANDCTPRPTTRTTSDPSVPWTLVIPRYTWPTSGGGH